MTMTKTKGAIAVMGFRELMALMDCNTAEMR
jgi:hypothetical protein